jgi:hypothetical protein
MISKFQKTLTFLIPLLVITLATILILPLGHTGTTDEKTTSSSATVNVWVEVSLSGNLTAGILFGNVNPNTNNNNATGNVPAGSTTYNVTAGAANNVNIDLCIKDDVPLTKGGDTIANSGYTYDWNAVATDPALPGTAITTSYAKTGHTNIAAGDSSHSRFWLDVPNAQPAGSYSNTVYLKGIETGAAC